MSGQLSWSHYCELMSGMLKKVERFLLQKENLCGIVVTLQLESWPNFSNGQNKVQEKD